MPTSLDSQVRYLVQTKLHPPHISREIVARPRLLTLFEPEAELTLVIAAAGYGKTTLLCDWLSALHRPAAWLTLDGDDDNLVQVLTYLTLAMRRPFHGFGDARFDRPLDIGDRISIADAAGYTMVKKNWFNGVNMPSIAIRELDGSVRLVRAFSYQDYADSLS